MQLICREKRLDLSVPRIMGVINITPDSFSDGGRWTDPATATERALRMIDEGADLIDIGGESTRPGARPVAAEEELERVIPVVRALAGCPVVISVDTRRSEVMRAALEAGADMINDIEALAAPGAAGIVAQSGAAVCLMHMRGTPDIMQQQPEYGDVVTEVAEFLAERAAAVRQAGVPADRIVLDPGFGFGKTLRHNLLLLRHFDRFTALGYPLLAGMSRKSMLGQITGRPVAGREFAGLAAHLYALRQGARIFRVHDVAAMRDALLVWQAIGDVQ